MAVNTDKSEPKVADLQAQIELLRKDVAELGHLMGAVGEAQVNGVRQTVRDKAEQARDKVRHEGEAYAHKAEAQIEAAIEAMQHQPATTLAITAGLGFLVGLLMGRR